MIFRRTAMAAMLAGALALAPATSKADEAAIGAGFLVFIVVGIAATAGSHSFDEVDVREAPQLRSRNEFRAGRLGVATEWAMTPAVGVGVWRGVGREQGVPTMMFLRMRY